jgi:hypothetical protein
MNWIQRNFKTLIYFAFLVPILTVAFVSISHVAKWYGLSNPVSWAIYLSFGVEIAALSALAAISAQMGRKVYFPFAIVTLIQFIGNIFFAYQFIDINSQSFKDWIDLVDPLVSFMGVESGDIVGHKRFLALFAGGMLPIISLSFLHMLVKFEEDEKKKKESVDPTENIDIDELSIAAGKEEAKYVTQKYTPTEEELIILEQRLREINENKFKALEEPIVDESVVEEIKVEEPIIEEPILDEPVIEESITEEPIVDETIIEEIKVEEPIVEEPIIEEVKVEEPTTITQPQVAQEKPINRLTYASRNASNVSVQRI